MPTQGHSRLSRFLPLGLAASLAAMLYLHYQPPSARQQKKRDQSIIDNASVAIISVDSRQIILHANRTAASLFGGTVQAMRGMPLGHFILRDLRNLDSGEGDGPFSDIRQELRLAGRRATDYTLTGRRSDGALFPLEGSLSGIQEGELGVYTILVRDISARKQVHEQLARSFSQLRELSNALQTIREEERRHIARELHDDLGQLLATLRVDLTLAQQHADMTPALQKLLLRMDGLLVTAISSLRRIAGNLRPRALDEGGLYFALQKLRQDFLLRQVVHFDLLADEAELVLDDIRSTAVYRIVQEALTNIARHAEASHITIALHRIDSSLAITIQDDGKGIADRDLEKAASLGLLGMRERVWGLNGNIQIGADSDLAGTRIDILLPIYTEEVEAE
ncbi:MULTISPECIES: PAS domain-containing sensor histidine kinase [unclassified Janthinobacterium]|uniref:PAS domain-containing sensor histidine kinase n=1 Tax=unclassified Janthinobacterium TaxID=2610881 RepID=UPI00161CF29A|nr:MULTISPECIES: PAS domain-containing sensor histidine kinase [unclassified Janthinobacterium]MBB5369787.1 PAS domain S-box-containing protein [Janthinobacterium sp. K2C7]MBB5382257.1 PAS domain S-box-containing protein [Janthinobacterium sp. K2Li3]MBB5387834.1 PAS domain S-box-containing protein [Janthinobacterium sp. K2E3]